MLISGYVGYRNEKYYPRLKNIFSLLLTVLFYSFSICLIFKLFDLTPITKLDILFSLIPTVSKQYWFFSAYFGLFLFSPLLNMAVHKSSKKHALIFLIFVTLISVYSIHFDPFNLNRGYGLCWFVILYCLGAIIKKYDLPDLLSRKKWLLTILLAFAIIWTLKILTFHMRESFLKNILVYSIIYVSPLVLVMAIGWVCFFSKITFKKINPKIISFFSTSAFSVYLIHDNSYIRGYVISKAHELVIDNNTFTLTLSIICGVLIIFFSCVLIDKVRILLFRLIKTNTLCEKAEKSVKNIVNAVYRKFDALVK